jgi:uracil-DNA glycosylase family 4
VLFIGEAPAKNEDREGIPFVGSTGQEFDNYYLPHCGLSRDDVGVTNARKCSDRGYRNPKPEEAKICADFHLPSELAEFDPEIIVPMGAVACSLITTRHGPIHLETQHCIPTIGKLYDWVGPVFPTNHPAAGIHDSKMLITLQRYFPNLKYVLSGQTEHWVKDQYPHPNYCEVTTRTEMDRVLRNLDPWEISIDTESDVQGPTFQPFTDPPYGLSFSGRPGTGYSLMVGSPLIQMLGDWIREKDPIIDLHNSLHDMPVTRRMDLHLNWSRVRDTMGDAYHTAGWLPQGLKQLAFRELGIRMSDYDDVVRPHALRPQLRYLLELSREHNIPQPYLKPRQWKLCRKAAAAWESTAKGTADPQDRWMNWEDEDRWAAEDHVGKFPYRSIRFVPKDQAVWYMGQDADATLRIRPVISRVLGVLRRETRS